MGKGKKRKLIAPPSGVPVTIVPLGVPSSWVFRCMLSNRGLCVIKPWLGQIPVAGQADFDRSLQQLAPQPQQHWHKPAPASTIGDNIFVIRFRDRQGTQHRTFGHFHSADRSAVLTLDGYEKDDVYYPKNYAKTTGANRTACDADHRARTIRCRYADAALRTTQSSLEDYHFECRDCPSCNDGHTPV